MTLGSHWSAFYDPIRSSRVPIGQLVMTWSSRLPIGQLSLYKTVPRSLTCHSQSMPPDMDMIGEHDALELQIDHEHVVYTGGAKCTDELVEEMAKQFGMQLEVLVPPNHPRATFITPSTVEVLMLANPHLHQAAEKLGKQMPSHF